MNTVLFLLVLLVGLAAVAALHRIARHGSLPSADKKTLLSLYGRTAGLSLVLFWVIRTAAERRIGLGPVVLFTFMADGALLPGRLACLFVCVLLSMTLFLTPAGARLQEKLSRDADRSWFPWALSLVVTALLVLWTTRVTVLSYMTNDDVYIISTIVRTAESGLSAAVSSFSHILFCGLFALLYSAAPNVLWYLGYHIAAIAISLVILGRCILLKTRKLGWNTVFGVLVLLCTHGLFLYSFSKLSFTVTPAIVGSAAVALILCRNDTPHRERIALDILGVILMVLSYLQRPVTARCILCFWALACAYHLVRLFLDGKDGRLRRMLSFLPYILAVLVLFGVFRNISYSGTYSQSYEYSNAEYYRSMVVDFLIDDITMEEYEDVGIPEELAILLHGWFFMDERITTETFRDLVEAHAADTSGTVSPASYPAQFLSAVWNDPQMALRFAALLALLLVSAAALIRNRRRSLPEFLTALFACGGAAILWLYLIYQGRFLIRVFLVVLYPAAVTVLLTALTAADGSAPLSARRRGTARILGTLGLACYCVLCLLCVARTPHIQESVTHDDVFAEEMTVEKYVGERPDATFITNIYETNLDPIHSTHYPDNRVLWGACGDISRSDRLYADAFFRDTSFFLCQKPGYIQFLLQYLTLDYGPVYAEMTDSLINDIVVYDVGMVAPGEDYTGWYEQNGMTYYFENGHAVSGTHTIDGVEYRFAPVGKDAGLMICPGESVIYTTDAYSLLSDAE